jgi:lysophospholipase L1-like esterase
MKLFSVRNSLALLGLGAITACGGGGSAGSAIPPGGGRPPQGSVLSRIVGVGDSLTAGYQSNGFLGATGVRNPLSPKTQVPPGQENGWWAYLVEQASNKPLESAINAMYDPSISPLPLIKGPGLNNQIVPWNNPFFPFGELKSGNTCTDNHGFNAEGYLLSGLSRVRMNPHSTTVRDVGVPGITLHEANTIHEPQTSTCKPLPGVPGLLSLVVAQESGTFWPVLGNFTHLGGKLTEVNAAASVHPTLATVWLGANDVLKYMGSGGRFVGGDRTPAQAAADVHQTVATLQSAGADVVVANLPNILETGFFQRVTIASRKQCKIQTYASCVLDLQGIPHPIINAIARKYHLATPQGCEPTSQTAPCGYLTLPGTIEIIQYYNTYGGEAPNLDCANPTPHCKVVPGSGLGVNYITPEFAAKVQGLNDAVNQGIGQAASSSGIPLVDVQTIFHGLATGDPSNPYFAQAASIKPGVCCSLGYLFGILSFDGLHPSNTGYALIAYDFIKTINHAYGTHIPEIDVRAVYDGTRCSNKQYCFPDPYAPPHDAPY